MIQHNQLFNQEFLSKEYLITNGIGGYASSTISGANTRKYHGVLVASLNPPTERHVLVAKVEERIFVGSEIDGGHQYFDLSVDQYSQMVDLEGYQYLKYFERRPVAKWIYGNGQWALEKKMAMLQGSNTTVIQYTNTGSVPMKFQVFPLQTYKNYHATLRQNDFDFYYERQDHHIKVHAFPGSQPVYFSWSHGEFFESREWIKDFHLHKEQYRGMDCQDDYYQLGFSEVTLQPGASTTVIISTEEDKVHANAWEVIKEAENYYHHIDTQGIDHQFYKDLLASGEQFIVDRASTNSKSILAGYHWFTDWGRDTMIAMRGLTIATGDQETSKSILSTFLQYVDAGMLPNRFPDFNGQEVEYNTIDATLWLFVAVYEYYQKFGDHAFVQQHLPQLEHIIQAHIDGTRYNIKMTPEGFIYGGQDGVQLTWMDAKVGDYVVTPRIGCPVEITVLWYNALKIFQELTDATKYQPTIDTHTISNRIYANFRYHFLNDQGYLNDVIIPDQFVDDDFRCNQILAVSLPFSLLTQAEEKELVVKVGRKLLTDYGLRSLDPQHQEFRAVYEGDQWMRDTAYHQGTVWSFFISEYATAYIKIYSEVEWARRDIKRLLEPLEAHFYNEDCIHGISEVFDGGNPKEGRGCVNQAWSVAALIKIYADFKLYEL